jgi:GTP-binding protein
VATPSKLRAPRWQVVQAEFETSAADLGGCPPGGLPEIAVAGRSNVGKSSLLNAFSRRTGLARVSRTPGRTRLLNFFRLRLRGQSGAKAGDLELRWVDLPGYGFAKASREVRDAFGPMIEGYLRGRDPLRGLIVLIDARHGPVDADFELFEFCAAIELPCLLCATKADKLGASERGLLPKQFAEKVGCDPRDVLVTSAQTGLGLTEVDRRGGLGDELVRLMRDETESVARDRGTESVARDRGTESVARDRGTEEAESE